MHLGIEETCWKNKTNILETTFSNGIIGCVSSFTDLFDKILLSDKGRTIAPDKGLFFFNPKLVIFFLFLHETYVVGTC